MVTTTRSYGETSSVFDTKSDVALLEREQKTETKRETTEEARARMQKNLDKLLHYEEYARAEAEVAMANAVMPEIQTQGETSPTTNEDIMPTSTTLQFAESENSEVMKEAKEVGTNNKSKFSLKSKIVAVLYGLAIAGIFSLIMLNSGVLSALQEKQASLTSELEALNNTYNQSVEQLENLENEAIKVAETEYGMIK